MAKWYEKLYKGTDKFVTGGLLPGGDKPGGIYRDIAGGASDYFMGPTRAARSQERAAREGMAAQERMFDKALEVQKPWLETGERQLSRLERDINSGAFEVERPGFDYQRFQGPDPFQRPEFQSREFNFEADPGYAFRQAQGEKAIRRAAAGMGGFASGATLADMAGFNQDLASQEYGAAYGRYIGEEDRRRQRYQQDLGFDYGQYSDDFGRGYGMYRDDLSTRYGMYSDDYSRDVGAATDRYNRIANLAGVGQTAATNIAGTSMAAGQGMADAWYNIGNARANRAMATQNTINPLLNAGLQGAAAYWGRR